MFIGGLYGIQAARYYLDVHRNAKLLLLEADDVIGGTWSSSMSWRSLSSRQDLSPATLGSWLGSSFQQDNIFLFERIGMLVWLIKLSISLTFFSCRTHLPGILDTDTRQDG